MRGMRGLVTLLCASGAARTLGCPPGGASYAWDEGARAQAQDAGVLTVTEDNFDEVVMKQQGPVLLMMYAAPARVHCLER